MHSPHPGVYRVNGRLATCNLAPGHKVYGEDLVKQNGKELRSWDAKRSKLAAALVNGLRLFPFQDGARILYLGAASGTTPSHVSDLVGKKGVVYCVEFSATVARDLIAVCETRENMLPIVDDARFPERYSDVGEVDVIYEDVADREQVLILEENAKRFLKDGGLAFFAVKSRSIDSTRPPKQVYSEVITRLLRSFDVLEKIRIDPFHRDHLFLVLRKR
ncbi:fibrillarin-like rRNA/tRNA 2'-O-methyltransferase [Candidatus Micrarchaeota archaeon]|nr:fibrillarin-like rRNA/tRNA 2'-O-methyltransferase [Candidatus Micrarchaeota archaeon]